MNNEYVLNSQEISSYKNVFYPQNAPYVSKHKKQQQHLFSRQSNKSNNCDSNSVAQNNSIASQKQHKDRALQTSQAKSQKHQQLEQQIIKLNNDIQQLLHKIDGSYEEDQYNKDRIKQLQDQNYYLKQEIQKINNVSMEKQLKLRLQKEQLEKLYKKQFQKTSSKNRSKEQKNLNQENKANLKDRFEDQVIDQQQDEESKQPTSNRHTIDYDIATRYIRPSRQIIIEQSKESVGSNFRQIQLQKIHFQQVNKKLRQQIQELSLQVEQKRRQIGNLKHSLSNHSYSKSQIQKDNQERIQYIQKQLESKHINRITSLEVTIQQYKSLFQKKSEQLSNIQYELYKYSTQVQRLKTQLEQQQRHSEILKHQKQKQIQILQEKLNNQIAIYQQRTHTQENEVHRQDDGQVIFKENRFSQQIYRTKGLQNIKNYKQNKVLVDEQEQNSLKYKEDINGLLQKRLKNLDSQRQRISQLSSIHAGNNINSVKRQTDYKMHIEGKLSKQVNSQKKAIVSNKMNNAPRSNRSHLASNKQDLDKTIKLIDDEKELLEKRLQKVNKDITILKQAIDEAYIILELTPNQSVSTVQRAIHLIQFLTQEFIRQAQTEESIKRENKSLRLQLDRSKLKIRTLKHQNMVLISCLHQYQDSQQNIPESANVVGRQLTKAQKHRHSITSKQQSQKGSKKSQQVKIQKYDEEKKILAKLKQNITKMINETKL